MRNGGKLSRSSPSQKPSVHHTAEEKVEPCGVPLAQQNKEFLNFCELDY